ncbi:hypothetical protein NECAME_16397 [Necator americanus]|uniref:Uncharacterized protein n=1 Tax=Necator americanus TaxID=51031 RepID=W2TWZ8_NECAM|nr:hypothetical protein NECAME_16397 [Necator americanus]ETN86338.1 hypothetical protein NECAME_16397 [Necator americanus]
MDIVKIVTKNSSLTECVHFIGFGTFGPVHKCGRIEKRDNGSQRVTRSIRDDDNDENVSMNLNFEQQRVGRGGDDETRRYEL